MVEVGNCISALWLWGRSNLKVFMRCILEVWELGDILRWQMNVRQALSSEKQFLSPIRNIWASFQGLTIAKEYLLNNLKDTEENISPLACFSPDTPCCQHVTLLSTPNGFRLVELKHQAVSRPYFLKHTTNHLSLWQRTLSFQTTELVKI